MFPGRATNTVIITRDISFPARGTHISKDMCFRGSGIHISKDIRFSGRGIHITITCTQEN